MSSVVCSGITRQTSRSRYGRPPSADKIIKRSLIDGILGHTHAAIEALGKLDGDLIGDMHRKMVDRASSQEVACSDLVAREIQFGDDYRKANSN